MNDKPTDLRFRHALRLPPFGVAIGMYLAALLAFAVWMFVDASFPATLEVIRIDLRLQEHPGVDMAETHGWDQLGSRLLLFTGLAAVGALATLLVFYRIGFGSHQGRSLRSLFLAVALVGLWLTLALSHEKIDSAGCHWRLHRAVQGLKQDAAILLAEWPTTDGSLPHCGSFSALGDLLWIDPSELPLYPLDEVVDAIFRTDGSLLFQCRNGEIEFRADGSKPRSFTRTMHGETGQPVEVPHQLDYYIELERDWYLVRYVYLCDP